MRPEHRVAEIVLQRETALSEPAAQLRERFSLTPAEVRVARLLAEGHTNASVSEILSISPHTARRHTERIFRKLEVRSRAEIARRLAS